MNICKECGAQWAIRTSDEDLCETCGLEHELQLDHYVIRRNPMDVLEFRVLHHGKPIKGEFYNKANAREWARKHRDGELTND